MNQLLSAGERRVGPETAATRRGTARARTTAPGERSADRTAREGATLLSAAEGGQPRPRGRGRREVAGEPATRPLARRAQLLGPLEDLPFRLDRGRDGQLGLL